MLGGSEGSFQENVVTTSESEDRSVKEDDQRTKSTIKNLKTQAKETTPKPAPILVPKN